MVVKVITVKRDPIADLMITYISNEERRNMKHDMVRTYSRKPKHVEAVLLSDGNIHDAAIWCGGRVDDRRETSDNVPIFELVVPNVSGNDTAVIGNVVIRDLSDGRFWVKGANFFFEEYEAPAEVRVDFNEPNAYSGIPGAVPVMTNVIKEVPADFDPSTEPLTPHYVPRMGRYDRG
ncbi:hypothetical protein PP914_gp239 [Arthrobacter phage Qui]|uniref:Uncharacterized protein n=1 Tax=Arthrobacter phage Qui TaxID=2603260 RepID=A0A5B8WIX8_9CAUD|nr:hypothetical protein PP914_gp239 [Arthrobacter phage Qui]QED11727.1 hypothetical protein SEA_QUI_239 [Arthrobacter phage Qui]QOC56559.1 hypothetical protein SEA_PAELLA_240 [Arthrobacter phage Paella]